MPWKKLAMYALAAVIAGGAAAAMRLGQESVGMFLLTLAGGLVGSTTPEVGSRK